MMSHRALESLPKVWKNLKESSNMFLFLSLSLSITVRVCVCVVSFFFYKQQFIKAEKISQKKLTCPGCEPKENFETS